MISDSAVKAFLKGFKNEYQTHLIDFCNKLSETHADVYFLMARKATCFFSCLEELGLVHFDGYVTSERVLDMDLHWLEGKKVVIIDDAIVSGTTLYNTISKLNAAGVDSVKVFVLTTNSRWFQPDMLERQDGTSYLDEGYDSIEDVECINLCYKVVEAILCYPRPYDIDFPLYKKFVIKPSQIKDIFHHSGWNSYEVTTIDQDRNDIRSFTIIPSCETQNRFLSQYRCGFIGENLLKIRVYIASKNKNKHTYEVRFLPVVVFDELSEDMLNDVFLDLVRDNQLFISAFNSTSSRLRFLQFFYSHKFMEFWCRDALKESLISFRELEFSENNLTYIFSDTVDSDIKDFCNACNYQSIIYNRETEVFVSDSPSNFDCNPIEIEEFLINQFISIHYEKEIPCREKVLELGRKVFDSLEYNQLVQRLNSGLTFRELVNKLSDFSKEVDAPTCVSVFLDRAIDYGMVVPITQIKQGIVTRAFRHGEDILFGEREEKLFAIMLRSFQENSRGNDPITRLSVEKMMVIFTKIGLSIDNRIFNPYLSNFSCNPVDCYGKKSNILRIKPYLKGNVALAGSVEDLRTRYNIPFAVDDDKAFWLTSLFLKKRYLSFRKEDKYNMYSVNDSISTSAIDLPTVNWCKRIGRLFGKICNNEIDTGITYNDDDLICLSTCQTVKDTTLAITSEINIFKEEWKNKDLHSISEHEFVKLKIYESPNSAYMKGRAFDNKKAWELVDKVKFDNETEQEEWQNFFYNLRYKDIKEEEKKEIYRAYNGGKYLSILLLYLVTLMDLLLLIRDTAGKKTARYDKLWVRLQLYHSEIETFHKSSKPGPFRNEMEIIEKLFVNLGNDFENHTMSFGVTEYLNDYFSIVNYIDNYIVPECNSYIEYVETMLGQSGKIHEVTSYKHVLCISYKFFSEEENNKFRDSIRKVVPRVKFSRTSELSDSDSPVPNIDLNQTALVWYVCDNDSELGEFAKFASLVLFSLYYVGCSKYKLIYIGDLPFHNTIICRKNDNTFLGCYNFYRFIDSMNKDIFEINDENSGTITTIIEAGSNPYNNFLLRFGGEKGRGYYDVYGNIEQYVFSNRTFIKSRIEAKKQSLEDNVQRIMKANEKVDKNMKKIKNDIGIITIIPEETKAVIKELNLKEKDFEFGSRLYFEGSVGDRTIVMTQALNPGNSSVVSTFNDLVNKYTPKFVFLIGIAGKGKDSIDFCDVVIASEVICYDFIKETNEGNLSRYQVYRAQPEIETVYQKLLFGTSEMKASDGSFKDTFKIRKGPIGSGSALIAADESIIKKQLSLVNDKILAVEMEGYGFSVASEENCLSENKTKGTFIIRGISDGANSNKGNDSIYRKPAVENAAILAKKLIEVIPSNAFD